ncbi:contact-dependent growth inhibition system immunity protein [Photorhabdus laumondii]|uniref:contact-dependent growth inhibition system immunity protein n=1 Tax=Photorhabdus laumondii TaxID=2218628 RepID=UPI0025B1A44D|nr:contact-dependent growth inhibition system immunity protein [Photorhabdus laumondii]
MELNRLMYAYFNQDFDIISGPELDDVINDYLDTANDKMKRELIEEIDSFIHNSKNVEEEFKLVYSDFDPDLWEITALDFLNHVSKRAQDHLDKNK